MEEADMRSGRYTTVDLVETFGQEQEEYVI